jgi:hypothetical protein
MEATPESAERVARESVGSTGVFRPRASRGVAPEAKPQRDPSCKRSNQAGDGTRTRDIQLGKLTLYQLSYTRVGGTV